MRMLIQHALEQEAKEFQQATDKVRSLHVSIEHEF